MAIIVKNPPANAGDAGEASLIPGLGRSLEEEMATPWKIPWTGELGRLQSMGLQTVRHKLVTYHAGTSCLS